MAHHFVIRKAATRDAEGIHTCLVEAFEPHRLGYTPGAFLDTTGSPDSIHEPLRTMTIYVATSSSTRKSWNRGARAAARWSRLSA